MKRELFIFLLTYLLASVISGIILFLTGFSFSIWSDNFNFIPFIIDLMIWIFSFWTARIFINKFYGN